jgi:hypothetical protein
MKHHAERIARIRRLLLEMEQQQRQLETMTRENLRMRTELQRQLRQATEPATTADRSMPSAPREKKSRSSKNR